MSVEEKLRKNWHLNAMLDLILPRLETLESRMSQLDSLASQLVTNDTLLTQLVASDLAFIQSLQQQIAGLTASGTVDPNAISQLQKVVDDQIAQIQTLTQAITTASPAVVPSTVSPATTAGPVSVASTDSGPATIPSA
jgi:hypothetical protein